MDFEIIYAFDILLNICFVLENISIDNERSLKALDVDPEYTLRDGFCFQFVCICI